MYLSRQIGSFRVAGGDGGMVPQQQVMHWRAHNLAAADHYRSLPRHRHTCRRVKCTIHRLIPTSQHSCLFFFLEDVLEC